MSAYTLKRIGRQTFYPYTLERYGEPAPPLRFTGDRPPRDKAEEHYLHFTLSFLRAAQKGGLSVANGESFLAVRELEELQGKERECFARALLDAAFYETFYYWKFQGYLEETKDQRGRERYQPYIEDEAGGFFYSILLRFAQSYRYDRSGKLPEIPPHVRETFQKAEEAMARGEMAALVRSMPFTALAMGLQYHPGSGLRPLAATEEALKTYESEFLQPVLELYGLKGAGAPTPLFPSPADEVNALDSFAGTARRIRNAYFETWWDTQAAYAMEGVRDMLREFREKGYIEVSPTQPRFLGGFPSDPDNYPHDWHLRYVGRVRNEKGQILEVWDHALDMGLGLGDEKGHFGESLTLAEFPSRILGPEFAVLFRHTPDPEIHHLLRGTLVRAAVWGRESQGTPIFRLDDLIYSIYRGNKHPPIPLPAVILTPLEGKTTPPSLDQEERHRRLASAWVAMEAALGFHRDITGIAPAWERGAIFYNSPLIQEVSFRDGRAHVVYQMRNPQGSYAPPPGQEAPIFDGVLRYGEGLTKKTLEARLTVLATEGMGRFLETLKQAWPEYAYGVMPRTLVEMAFELPYADSNTRSEWFGEKKPWEVILALKEAAGFHPAEKVPAQAEEIGRWLRILADTQERMAELFGADERGKEIALFAALGLARYYLDVKVVNLKSQKQDYKDAQEMADHLRETLRELLPERNLPLHFDYATLKEVAQETLGRQIGSRFSPKSSFQQLAEAMGVSVEELEKIVGEAERA